MRFDQPHDVEQIFLSFAWPALGITPSGDLASERVSQRSDPHPDPMHIGRDTSRGKFPVEILGANLYGDL